MTSVCATCGNHFPGPRPDVCVVCADERQWLPPGGQRWTTLAELAAAGHASDVREAEPGLTGIGADPPGIYGGWWTPVLRSDAWETVRRSATRYIEHLRGTA